MTVHLSTSLICSTILLIISRSSKLSQELDQTWKTNYSLIFHEGGRRHMSTYEQYSLWFNSTYKRKIKGADTATVIPNVTVAKDGTGNFTTINQALSSMPKEYKGRYIIYVKIGIYDEHVLVNMVNVLMYGDGANTTIITGNKSSFDGITTSQTATFTVTGNKFIAKSIGFQNTAGAVKHQAVALRVQSDMSAFFKCRMDGFQDTLYAQQGKQFYRDCVISGTIDFIFGDATTIFQNCQILLHKPMENQENVITAQNRQLENETTGFVIHNSEIIPDDDLLPVKFQIRTYLGRPWGEYSRTVYMESQLGDFIQPAGWMPWNNTDFGLNTSFYAEYGNTGLGANTTNRVRWPGFRVITNRNETTPFTVEQFIQGGLWLNDTGIPYIPGLKG